jgi:hypothetical protein
VQTRSLATASQQQFASVRKTGAVNRNLQIDVTTFLDYVRAEQQKDDRFVTFLRNHARREFRPAFEAWIADYAAGREDAPLPFLRPEYRLADQEAAAALDTKAAASIAVSNDANAHGDLYVLHTVMFAMALFFLGTTTDARRPIVRRVTLIFGALVFTLTVISTARLPRAPSEAHQKRHSAATAAATTAAAPKR